MCFRFIFFVSNHTNAIPNYIGIRNPNSLLIITFYLYLAQMFNVSLFQRLKLVNTQNHSKPPILLFTLHSIKKSIEINFTEKKMISQ